MPVPTSAAGRWNIFETRNRTTFIIAHRFSTIARADLIVVLDQGRIVGIGQHQELLETCPFYGTLVKTQFAHGLP